MTHWLGLSFLAAFTALSAHADFAPSVWDQQEQNSPSVFTQMQEGRVNTIEVKATGVNVGRDSVHVNVDSENDDGEVISQTYKLCDEPSNPGISEAQEAMLLNQRVESFRRAKKSQKTVRLNSRGPWNPCVTPASL